MGSATVRTVDTAGRSEIASIVDDGEAASIVDDTVEDNLNACLKAACSGDERPVGSHPMRLATVLCWSAEPWGT